MTKNPSAEKKGFKVVYSGKKKVELGYCLDKILKLLMEGRRVTGRLKSMRVAMENGECHITECTSDRT